MKNRSIIILVVIVAALAAYIMLFERHLATTNERQEMANLVFPDFAEETITTIEISSPDGELSLAKTKEKWRMTSPLNFAADQAAVKSLFDALSKLKVERRLTAEQVDPAVYGLDTPEMRVTLGSGDTTLYQLVVGNATALGSNRAVSTGNSEVLLCPSNFISRVNKNINEWRSKSVIDVFENDVASIELTTSSERIKIVRIDDKWSLLEPVMDRAGPQHIRQMIADLNALNIEAFVDASEDLNALGLEPPSYQLLIVPSDGEAATRLDFGITRVNNEVTQVVCRRDNTDVFWVRDTIITPLAKAGVRWRDPKICGIDSWAIESLEIRSGETTIVADRHEGIWVIGNASVDPEAMQDLLSSIADLEAKSYDLMAPATPERARLILHLRPSAPEGKPTNLEIVFYEPMTSGGRALVTISGRNTVMSVDTSDLDDIFLNTEKLQLPPNTSES